MTDTEKEIYLKLCGVIVYLMSAVSVKIISNNGLTKKVYHFEATSHAPLLVYSMFSEYNRSTKSEIWPDEWPAPKSFMEWVKDFNISYDFYEFDEDGWSYESESYHDGYKKYCNMFNPCMVKTTDGRVCGGGMAGNNLDKSHPINYYIKKKAKEIYIKNLKVR